MPLDLKRFRRDVDRKRLPDVTGGDPQSKPSGAMAVVRAHLGEIEQLKSEGATWVAIAAAMAEQGVRLRDGRPITGRHLTGLIDSIRRQDAGRRMATARRASRADVASEPLPPAPRQSGVPTSSAPRAAVTPEAEPAAPSPGHRTAEQIRREGLADLYDMLEGKKS
jgi:hypothetical protein